MNESGPTAYLQQVLALGAEESAAEMLQLRRAFLSPDDVIVAWAAGESGDDMRARVQYRLDRLRREFWQMEEGALRQQLALLQSVEYPEVVVAAKRLLHVAAQRAALLQLRQDRRAHPAFVAALTEILVGSNTAANLLREREHGWMRPEQNAQHVSARRAIAATIEYLRVHYPQVYALEEIWLNELVAYNPEDEKADEASNFLFGVGLIVLGIVTLGGMIGIVMWIFS